MYKLCLTHRPLFTDQCSRVWPPILFSHFYVLDSGGEEPAEGRREAQTGLHQARVSTGGVEMEEQVSLHIHTITLYNCLVYTMFALLSAFVTVCPRKGEEIYHQLRRLGASLDWSRACFTMDPVRLQSHTLLTYHTTWKISV